MGEQRLKIGSDLHEYKNVFDHSFIGTLVVLIVRHFTYELQKLSFRISKGAFTLADLDWIWAESGLISDLQVACERNL